MSKSITPGQLLARVLKDEGISIRMFARRMHLPPTRVEAMLTNTRGFEPVTMEKFADVLSDEYGIVWWRLANMMAKSGRLFDDIGDEQ